MNKNLEHYVFHKKNFLKKTSCKTIITQLNKNKWSSHEWTYQNEVLQPTGNTEPEMIFVKDFSSTVAEINNEIVQNLQSAILEYLKKLDFDWFDRWDGYTAIKFIRYNKNQTMRNHCDHIHSMFEGERKGIPTLSIIGVLNDNYEGGELVMFEDKTIHTQAGDLIIFPSNFLFPHEIKPVTKGVRYSYVSWVW